MKSGSEGGGPGWDPLLRLSAVPIHPCLQALGLPPHQSWGRGGCGKGGRGQEHACLWGGGGGYPPSFRVPVSSVTPAFKCLRLPTNRFASTSTRARRGAKFGPRCTRLNRGQQADACQYIEVSVRKSQRIWTSEERIWFGWRPSPTLSLSLSVCVCVCVCVRARARVCVLTTAFPTASNRFCRCSRNQPSSLSPKRIPGEEGGGPVDAPARTVPKTIPVIILRYISQGNLHLGPIRSPIYEPSLNLRLPFFKQCVFHNSSS